MKYEDEGGKLYKSFCDDIVYNLSVSYWTILIQTNVQSDHSEMPFKISPIQTVDRLYL